MFRSRDYIPLSTRANGDHGSPHGKARNIYDKRRRILQGAVALSVVVNLYLLYTWYMTWPLPLDNYQELNTYPIIDVSALDYLPPANPHNHAVVTGLYTDAFATAVATLGHTLNVANSSASRISRRALCIATVSGWQPVPIERIAPPFRGVHRHFLDQYSKLHLWTLDQRGYKSVVYVDADALVRRNFDELFRLPWTFAAVPDVYVKPQGAYAGALFRDMVAKIATAHYPAEQAEQAFLNHYFGAEALRLPYAYNANLAIKKRTPALWKGLQDEMRIMHFTMAKPFLQGDYDEVPIAQLEKNAEKVARRKSAFREEITEWLEAWRDTRSTYETKLAECDAQS
ncbi:nucleotide-diphospho-sugar transferase [Trametes punicea]|nr:nucleotide-diphospho-sugar transferase [Trametes punicea]